MTQPQYYSEDQRPLPPSVDVSSVDRVDVRVDMPEPGKFHFSFAQHYLFPNPNAVFVVLRDALSAYLTAEDRQEQDTPAEEPVFLLIKYASRVYCSNMPMIHSPADRVIYVDPLLPLRDIVMEVNRTKNVTLFAFPSRHYFFRQRTRPEDFPSNPKPKPQSARTLSVEPPKPYETR